MVSIIIANTDNYSTSVSGTVRVAVRTDRDSNLCPRVLVVVSNDVPLLTDWVPKRKGRWDGGKEGVGKVEMENTVRGRRVTRVW